MGVGGPNEGGGGGLAFVSNVYRVVVGFSIPCLASEELDLFRSDAGTERWGRRRRRGGGGGLVGTVAAGFPWGH